MTIKQFYIELENPIRSFSPGQSITGRIIVESFGDTNIQGIRIDFIGEASVYWTEKSAGDNRRSDTYSSSEQYFHCKVNVAGGHEPVTNGHHAYPFAFTLPSPLPTSFNGPHGKIYYYMEAKLKQSWKFDRKAMVPFTVNSVVDLNRYEHTQLPVELRKQKNICCLCCRSGPVGFVLKMERKGYVPGEYIDIESEIYNQSTRKVQKIDLKLYQTTHYRATTKTRSETKFLCVATGPCVERGDSKAWVGRVLQIPPVPPSTMGECQIIDVEYSLKVEMHLSGPSVNLKGYISLIIGTIPLGTTFSGIQSQANENQMQGNQSNFTGQYPSSDGQPPTYKHAAVGYPLPSAPGFEDYPDLPPPTNAEAMSVQPAAVAVEENIARP